MARLYRWRVLDLLTSQLERREALSADQVAEAVACLTDEALGAEPKAAFLTALARKGETVEEVTAFARALREKAIVPPLDAETRARVTLDVVGTGGDRVGTFNISTTAAILASAAGVTVAKHGNRAVTSQTGSADVLEALGIPIDLRPEEAAAWLRDRRFAFFLAPQYHPAFKHIGPARRLCAERGQRTLFNILGPLLNPARPTTQVVGVPRPEFCVPVASALQRLGIKRGMVVCGLIGSSPRGHGTHCGDPGVPAADPVCIDELSTLGETTVAEFYQDHGFSVSHLSLLSLPLQPATLADLLGGDRQTNAAIARRVLCGEERGPKRDAVLLTAGAALFVAGAATSVTAGWDLAAEAIDSGQAKAKLAELQRGRKE